MHLLAEVAPAEALPLLETLVVLLEYFVALGAIVLVIYIVTGLVKILDRVLPSIPFVGSAARNLTDKIARDITDSLGSAVSTIDRQIAFWWHALAWEADQIGRQIEEAAHVSAAILSLLAGVPNAQARGWIHAAISLALRPVHAAEHAVERRLTSLEKRVTHAVGVDVLPRIKAVEHELGHVIAPEIKSTRALAGEAEDAAQKAWNLVKSKPWLVGSTAFAGAVAVALSKLGLSWVRCSRVGSVGRALCGGLGGLLDALLVGALEGFAVADLCGFVDAIERAAELIRPVLYDLVDAEEALIGCHGATAIPAFNLQTTLLPTANLQLPLAA